MLSSLEAIQLKDLEHLLHIHSHENRALLEKSLDSKSEQGLELVMCHWRGSCDFLTG